VVVVLSTLLIIGVLFAITVDLDFKAAKYYKKAGQAELYALEGLYRATAELQYDVWGVNEDRAFRLSDSTESLTYNGDGEPGVDSAYYTTGRDRRPGTSDDQPIIGSRSRLRRTVELIQNGANSHYTLTDLRWMVEDGSGTSFAPTTNKRYIHSGAMYHDEFLPEGTDVADAFELGMHVNRRDIYFEGEQAGAYRNDKKTSQYIYFDPNPPGGDAGWDAWFWHLAYQNASAGVNPQLKYWDYIDSRVCGDSFYKIFRTEMVHYDGLSRQWRSNAAGVYDRLSPSAGEAMPRTPANWLSMKTHMGYQGFSVQTDPRGGAENINSVNNNYSSETSFGLRLPFPMNLNSNPYEPIHYRESKWITIYSEDGEIKLGRYAVTVWPDCGHPNANYLPDSSEISMPRHGSWNGMRRPETFFNMLDALYSPRGGPLFSGASMTQNDLYNSQEGDVIKSDLVVGGSNNVTLYLIGSASKREDRA
jgi:hypothetical protein